MQFSDAQRVLDSLRFARGYSEIKKTLVSPTASSAQVRKQVAEVIQNSTAADTIVLYFAGHGLASSDSRLALAVSDTKIRDIPGSAVAWSTIAEQISESKSRVIVLLDVCHAGLSDPGLLVTNEQAGVRLMSKFGASIIIMAASKGRQFSEESPTVGGGYFSLAFAEIVPQHISKFTVAIGSSSSSPDANR
jgi:uncharacterized caspase-like protein